MDGIKALISSEKAIASGVLVFAATLFVVLGKMTVAEWQEYTLWALGIYVGGKTVQGATQAVANMNSASVTNWSLGGGKSPDDPPLPPPPAKTGIGTSP